MVSVQSRPGHAFAEWPRLEGGQQGPRRVDGDPIDQWRLRFSTDPDYAGMEDETSSLVTEMKHVKAKIQEAGGEIAPEHREALGRFITTVEASIAWDERQQEEN